MHDLKNIVLAWLSATPVVVTATGEKSNVAMISAIVLPIIFFTIGKTIDVMLQIYFRKKEESRSKEKKG